MARLTWLGHSGFLLESKGKRLVIDAWLKAPTWPGTSLDGVNTVVVSHGHFDHAESAPDICKKTGATLVCIHEVQFWAKERGVPEAKIISMNMGGTVHHDGWSLTMVPALHSGGCPGDGAHGHHIVSGGAAAGWVIETPDGEVLYHAGDTTVFGDMALIRELYAPRLALLPIGGHFTMDPRGA
jgi:L-ascorbate metabolism protein UlaG (beta-lactamase superfamily)